MALGEFIVGMNLHGKFLLGKNKLYEKREIMGEIRLSSGPLRRQLGPYVAQFLTGEWAGGEAAFVAGHPRFAERLGQIGFLGEKRRERKRAPGARTKYRFEARGTQIDVSRSHFAWPKKRARRRNPSSIRSMEVA